MNNERRRQISNFMEKHDKLQKNFKALIESYEDLKTELQMICEDEELSFENMGNFQSSFRGMQSEEAIDHLNEALIIMDEVTEELENIV